MGPKVVIQFKGMGACKGLVPVLSYLESNTETTKGSDSAIKKLNSTNSTLRSILKMLR